MPEQKSEFEKSETTRGGQPSRGQAAASGPGTLSVLATPIGNLEDISLRALRCLREADIIVAEDTRHTRKLLTHFDIHKPLISYYQEVEKQKSQELVHLLAAGKHLAVVTDAGTPGVSDPGVHLIQAAKRAGISVVIIPGASALLTALLGSGLDMGRFSFFGFLEPKSGPRRKELEQWQDRRETLVFFLPPHRAAAVLHDMAEVWGDRFAVLCREMTKLHEEFISGTLPELAEKVRNQARGEYTLVVSGSKLEKAAEQRRESLEEMLARLQAGGMSLNQAVARIAREQNLARGVIYAQAHALQKKQTIKHI